MLMSIGQTIKTLRESKGNMSLSELARQAKISRGYLSQIENGDMDNPSVLVCVRLCKVLGITVEQLVKGTYQAPEPKVKRVIYATDAEYEQITALLNEKE